MINAKGIVFWVTFQMNYLYIDVDEIQAKQKTYTVGI